jgi:hypothetical protein
MQFNAASDVRYLHDLSSCGAIGLNNRYVFDVELVNFNGMWTCRKIPVFRKNILLSSSDVLS